MDNWTTSDIPPQRGRIAVVTGTGGLGYEHALSLARAGATVILAGRGAEKGLEATRRIRDAVPGAKVEFTLLDLASLDSIAACGARLRAAIDRVDVLINNAGVMNPPERRTTADGFELQFGTNHLGHFALTAQLLPLLRRSDAARVVTLSSVAARQGRFDFDDLQSERAYRPMVAYAQSKLACLVFAMELQRRSESAGWSLRSIAAHPGISRTDLLLNGAGPDSAAGRARRWLWFLFQPAANGAWPTLFAATAPQADGGAYYGPGYFGETRGAPSMARVPDRALDLGNALRLWDASERLTGLRFDGDGQEGGDADSVTAFGRPHCAARA